MSNQLETHHEQGYLEALVQHDQQYIDRIYRENAASIRSMVVSNGGSAQDARDVFQEALTSIYRQARQGYLLNGTFKSFFYAVCRNKWMDELKKRRRSEVTILESERQKDIQAHAVAEAMEIHEERLALLAKTLEHLGESCQNILRMAWSIDPETGKYHKLADIAEKLQISYGYLRKKKSECEQTLRNKMEASPEFKTLKGE